MLALQANTSDLPHCVRCWLASMRRLPTGMEDWAAYSEQFQSQWRKWPTFHGCWKTSRLDLGHCEPRRHSSCSVLQTVLPKLTQIEVFLGGITETQSQSILHQNDGKNARFLGTVSDFRLGFMPSLSLSLSPSLSLSLHFNGHFQGEPGLAGVYWSKGCPSCHPTNSVKALKGSYNIWFTWVHIIKGNGDVTCNSNNVTNIDVDGTTELS